jgi:hypothetical protein
MMSEGIAASIGTILGHIRAANTSARLIWDSRDHVTLIDTAALSHELNRALVNVAALENRIRMRDG